MRSQLLTLTILAAAFSVTACAKKGNPRLQAPPEIHEEVDQAAPKVESSGDPKVNILFVVDNSQSMDAHQARLKANINRFADKFFDNPRIDYRIGVVPVFDSKFLHDEKQDYTYFETVNGKRVTKVGPRIMVQNEGELFPLRDANGQVIDSAPYITRETPDAINVLKNTVAIGTQWGPEAEKSFSPVLKVISDSNLNKKVNAGFYQKDAYLVVIFLTDADDASNGISASTFMRKLIAAKGGINNKNKILIAAALPGSKVDSADCRLDGKGPQSKFPQLMRISQGTVADLCSNSFGDTLAALGDRLVEQVGSQRIRIKEIPDSNSIEVSYGAKNSKEEDRKRIDRGTNGWYYNIENQEIVLSPDINIERVKNGEIFVKYTRVSIRSLNGDFVRASGAPAAIAPKAKQ